MGLCHLCPNLGCGLGAGRGSGLPVALLGANLGPRGRNCHFVLPSGWSPPISLFAPCIHTPPSPWVLPDLCPPGPTGSPSNLSPCYPFLPPFLLEATQSRGLMDSSSICCLQTPSAINIETYPDSIPSSHGYLGWYHISGDWAG